MADFSSEHDNRRVRTVLKRACAHLAPLLFLLVAGVAKAQCTNAWTSQTAASGTGKEILLNNHTYIQIDAKATGFTGTIVIYQYNISGRAHWNTTIDLTVGTTTCPTAAGTSDPCLVNLNPGYDLVRVDYTRSAGTLDSVDVCSRK